MITESCLYWILILDGIKESAAILGIVLMFLSVCLCVSILQVSKEHVYEKIDKCRLNVALFTSILGLILILVSIFLPSSKQMATIKLIPTMLNQEESIAIKKCECRLLGVLFSSEIAGESPCDNVCRNVKSSQDKEFK